MTLNYSLSYVIAKAIPLFLLMGGKSRRYLIKNNIKYLKYHIFIQKGRTLDSVCIFYSQTLPEFERSENMPFQFSSEMARKHFSLYKHVGSQIPLLISRHTDAELPGNPCLILSAEEHNGEKQWRVCLLLMIGYRVLHCMSNGAIIFWQLCHQSMGNGCKFMSLIYSWSYFGTGNVILQDSNDIVCHYRPVRCRSALYLCELSLEIFTCSLPRSE